MFSRRGDDKELWSKQCLTFDFIQIQKYKSLTKWKIQNIWTFSAFRFDKSCQSDFCFFKENVMMESTEVFPGIKIPINTSRNSSYMQQICWTKVQWNFSLILVQMQNLGDDKEKEYPGNPMMIDSTSLGISGVTLFSDVFKCSFTTKCQS